MCLDGLLRQVKDLSGCSLDTDAQPGLGSPAEGEEQRGARSSQGQTLQHSTRPPAAAALVDLRPGSLGRRTGGSACKRLSDSLSLGAEWSCPP